jgi:hypothetical protein
MPERMHGSRATIARVRRTPGRLSHRLDPHGEHGRPSRQQAQDAALEVSPVDRFDVGYVLTQFPVVSRTSHDSNSGGFFATTAETDQGILDMAADNGLEEEIDLGERSRQAGLPTGPSSASTPRGGPAGRSTRDRQRGDLRSAHADLRRRRRFRVGAEETDSGELITWRD